MKPFIYYRDDGTWTDEEGDAALAAGFSISTSRLDVPLYSVVVARYSALPFFKELQHDVHRRSSCLINSYIEHRYIADIQNWYEDLKDFTPKTWFRPQDVPINHKGSFVLKGCTNSKKHLWDTHCYARDRAAVYEVLSNLLDDTLISTQNIVVREYVPLKRLLTGIRNLPITEEYRFFTYKGVVLSSGFYWSSHVEELKDAGIEIPSPSAVPESFIRGVLDVIKDKAPFVVVDVARTEDDNWIVVELNDGMMSGLSENNPKVLYTNLYRELGKE